MEKRYPATRETWKNEPMPEKSALLPVDRVYTPAEMALIRRGVIPVEMEDKWFIFYEDDILYCHRSWTGYMVYEARFVQDGDTFRVAHLRVNRDPEEYRETDDGFDVRLFVYLIDLLILNRPSEPPRRTEPRDDATHALGMWSLFGRGYYRDDEVGR